MNARRLWPMAAYALLIFVPAPGGCLMHDVQKDPTPPIDLPDVAANGANKDRDPGLHDPGQWWTGFGDPALDQLIAQALKNNLVLAQSWARLQQGKALERAAIAGLFPTVRATTSVGRSQSAPRVLSLGGSPQTVPGSTSSTFGASLPMSYELDLWGRVRAGSFAAKQDSIALRADVEAAAMTIAANVTERWFDMVEQRALINLIGSQIEVNQTNIELIELRFQQGDAALSDILQQRQQIQALRRRLVQSRHLRQIAQQRMALLVGKWSETSFESDRAEFPEPPPLPERGIPASLLERRPDLRAAKARVVAADYRVAQAIAARLPSLTLTGSIGFSAINLSTFFESVVTNIVGQIGGTIWDGGRLDAEVDRHKAIVNERLAAYGQALLTALVEVETALVREHMGRQNIDILNEQLTTARRTLETARARFAAGIGNYLPVLTAVRSLQNAEQDLIATRRQVLSERVGLYRALGSDWTHKIMPKEPSPKNDNDPKEQISK